MMKRTGLLILVCCVAVTMKAQGNEAIAGTYTFGDFVPNKKAQLYTTWQLTDARDNKSYRVRLMPDGQYWMVDDLRYGGDQKNGDSCAGRTTIIRSDSKESTHTDRFGQGTFGDCINIETYKTPRGRGYYYNWAAAMQSDEAYAGAVSQSVSVSGTESRFNQSLWRQGLCPAGWHLPTKEEFELLYEKSAAGGTCADSRCWDSNSAWEGVLGGVIAEDGYPMSEAKAGRYWTSTVSGPSSARSLQFTGPSEPEAWGLKPRAKWSGLLIRCVRNY